MIHFDILKRVFPFTVGGKLLRVAVTVRLINFRLPSRKEFNQKKGSLIRLESDQS